MIFSRFRRRRQAKNAIVIDWSPIAQEFGQARKRIYLIKDGKAIAVLNYSPERRRQLSTGALTRVSVIDMTEGREVPPLVVEEPLVKVVLGQLQLKRIGFEL